MQFKDGAEALCLCKLYDLKLISTPTVVACIRDQHLYRHPSGAQLLRGQGGCGAEVPPKTVLVILGISVLVS